MQLARLLRTPLLSSAQVARGPKKKGQAQAKIQSNDIINIFKDRQDPIPQKSLRDYPIFVQQMSICILSRHEQMMAAMEDIEMIKPSKCQYKSYIRGVKRQRFKALRQTKLWDYQNIEKVPEKFQINNRHLVFDLFAKTKEEIAEEQKKIAEEAAKQAMEEDQEYDI